jgi:hypothetical protein
MGMNSILATSLLAIAAYSFSSQALGECSQAVKEFIRNSGGNKEAAIAHTRKMVANTKNDKSGPFWKLPKNQRQEMFTALDEDANDTINSIQSCTESDLASNDTQNTPRSAKGSQSSSAASNCGASISWSATNVVKYPPSTTTYRYSWELISENPVKIRYAINGETHDHSIEASIAIVEQDLEYSRRCSQDQFCQENIRGEEKALAWLRCIASNKGGSVTASAGAASTQAEQIPNCPPTLSPSCVTWSLYDQQLQWWNLTNNCGRDASVTFRSEGALENTQTFGNGESYRAKWRGSNPPKQIVWDSAKGVGFYRNKPAGAALKCQASLPL